MYGSMVVYVCMDALMYVYEFKRMNGCICMYVCMDVWMHGCMDV